MEDWKTWKLSLETLTGAVRLLCYRLYECGRTVGGYVEITQAEADRPSILRPENLCRRNLFEIALLFSVGFKDVEDKLKPFNSDIIVSKHE